MKKITRVLLLMLLVFSLSGCGFIMDLIKPEPKPNENDQNEEKFSVTFEVYHNGIKTEELDIVQVDYLSAEKDVNNKIKILENIDLRSSFILENQKIITMDANYEFTMTRDYHFKVFIVDQDKVSFVALDQDNTYLGLLIFPKHHHLQLDDTLELIPVLNISEEQAFAQWNQALPSVLMNDVFVKPIILPIEKPLNIELSLSKDYEMDNNNVTFSASLSVEDENVEVLQYGFITLESKYFIGELTLDNIDAKKIYASTGDKNLFTLSQSKDALSKLNVRAYAIVKSQFGLPQTYYSEYIHTPFIYSNDLFFASYIEGVSGYDKAVTIFNGTGHDINLTNYKINTYFNGQTSPTSSISLSGILPHGKTYIIAHNDFLLDGVVERIKANKLYGQISNNLIFNGNDALELVKDNQPIDRIGTIGNDSNFGMDVSYIRSSHISDGNITNWTKEQPFSFENGEWKKIDKLTDAEIIINHQVDLLGYDHNYYQQLKTNVNNELSYIIRNLNERSIVSDLDLFKTSYLYPNVSYQWTSSHPEIISHDGVYLYPTIDTVVSFQVKIFINGEPQQVLQVFEVNVLSHKYKTVVEADFNNQEILGWETNSEKLGILNKNQFLQSPNFNITNQSKIAIKTLNSQGTIKIFYLNNNEAIHQEEVLVNKDNSNYVLVITNVDINNLKIELIDGEMQILTFKLLEEPLDNKEDYQAPIIFANIPSRVLRGSEVDIDACYAVDNVDGKLSCEVIEGNIDVDVIGTYKIILYAIDSSNNAATLELIITVYRDGTYKKLETDPTEVLVKFIDLGKYYVNSDGERGESIYIKIGEIDILVDAGMPFSNTEKAIDEVLTKYLTDKLDYIIATHPDQDHIGGFPHIFENYDVGMAIIYSTNLKTESQTVKNFKAALNDEPGLDVCEIKDVVYGNSNKDYCVNQYQLAPSVTITFIDTNYLTSDKTNESSIVFVLDAFGTRVLLNGDAEKDQEQVFAPKVGKVDIFKLGHHGTRNATTDFLLRHLNPEVAIVTHGTILGNGHGHPTFEAINRIYGYNSKIKIFTPAGGGSEADNCQIIGPSYRCEPNNPNHQRNGTITVQITSDRYKLTSERYGNNILEFSTLTFWQNHPERKYSYGR